jgi:glycosyltransferase involved in cell wall biosynthesis
MMPIVSVLIPVYNREKLVIGCINSVLQQSMSDLEVIVVDNASTDGTWNTLQKISEQDSRVRIFRNESNIGPVKNWFKCLEYSNNKSEFIKILFSDDWLEPDYLKEAMLLFSNESIGMVGSQVHIHDKHHQIYYKNDQGSTFSSRKFIEGVLSLSGYCASPSAWFIRRKNFPILKDIMIPNNFNINYLSHGMGSDTLLLLESAMKSPLIGFLNKPLVHFGAPEDSITVSTSKNDYLKNRIVANAYYIEKNKYYFSATFCKKFNALAILSMLRCFGMNGFFAYLKLFKKSYPRFSFSFYSILEILNDRKINKN